MKSSNTANVLAIAKANENRKFAWAGHRRGFNWGWFTSPLEVQVDDLGCLSEKWDGLADILEEEAACLEEVLRQVAMVHYYGC